MASEPNIGQCCDKYGDYIDVSVDGEEVIVTFRSLEAGVEMIFDAEQRDAFMRLLMEAERQAEANGSAVMRPCCDHCDNSEATGHGYTLSGPHAGRCEECAHEAAIREHDSDD